MSYRLELKVFAVVRLDHEIVTLRYT